MRRRCREAEARRRLNAVRFPFDPQRADCQLNANQLSLGAMRNVWTQERDEELIRYKAAGLSASKIASLLHTTRGAILGRSNRLRRGSFKSSSERLAMRKIAMAKSARRPRRKNSRKSGLIKTPL
jgi:hypothetical protein